MLLPMMMVMPDYHDDGDRTIYKHLVYKHGSDPVQIQDDHRSKTISPSLDFYSRLEIIFKVYDKMFKKNRILPV